MLNEFVEFIISQASIGSKESLIRLALEEFNLIRDRKVYYSPYFAVRFCLANKSGFSNTVLSLSALMKYDNLPFLVCLVKPLENYLFLGNSTFLKKISHSSQELRQNNIKGSFNGSDIFREFEGIKNTPENFDRLFAIHDVIGFEGNLTRLVEATNNISPTGVKALVTDGRRSIILNAPNRAATFILSSDYKALKDDLDAKVQKFGNEILLAALIENVNVRGRVIEYLIAGEDETLRNEIINSLRNKRINLPLFKTENALGDYQKVFPEYFTETDVKTKIMILNSNPKAYNLDKMLEFLATEKSVFMFYFIGVGIMSITSTVLVSMFQSELLDATITLKHWAGRNSRGVTQFEGKTISDLLINPKYDIKEQEAKNFLQRIIDL